MPIEDNTNEIDIYKLRELVSKSNSTREEKQIKENLNILEQRKRRIDEQKVYDINKILEKAKYENKKLKTGINDKPKPKRDLLSTLESTELSLDDINKAKEKYQESGDSYEKVEILEISKEDDEREEKLSITRELKYKNLESQLDDEGDDKIYNTSSLTLDLFEDLKPTGNTIVTKPIKPDEFDKTESDIHSGDTSDIDIIKNEAAVNVNNNQNDFFTSSYAFSKKDFADSDDDFFEPPKSGGIFKILMLVLAIFIFIGVIIYFIGTYGLGVS